MNQPQKLPHSSKIFKVIWKELKTQPSKTKSFFMVFLGSRLMSQRLLSNHGNVPPKSRRIFDQGTRSLAFSSCSWSREASKPSICSWRLSRLMSNCAWQDQQLFKKSWVFQGLLVIQPPRWCSFRSCLSNLFAFNFFAQCFALLESPRNEWPLLMSRTLTVKLQFKSVFKRYALSCFNIECLTNAQKKWCCQ